MYIFQAYCLVILFSSGVLMLSWYQVDTDLIKRVKCALIFEYLKEFLKDGIKYLNF